MGCLVAIDNFLWNVKIIPTRIELEIRSRKIIKDSKQARKKQDRNTMKMAERSANQDRDEVYSDSVRNSIITITKDDDTPVNRIKLINKACDTNKLIQFALFYMTDKRAQLMSHKQIEKEIVNGIAALFDFGKIYNDAGVSSLKMYDFDYKEDYLQSAKYILSIKDIKSRKNDPVFMEKLEKRKADLYSSVDSTKENSVKEFLDKTDEKPVEQEPVEQKSINVDTDDKSTNNDNKSSSWVKDENGIIHPVFITDNPIYLNEDNLPIQGDGISDDMFNRLESELNFVLSEKKHRYELDTLTGMIKLFVSKGSVEEFFMIDPARIVGMGHFCIVGRVPNDEILVPFECKEIVEKIINHSFYMLTPDETNTVFSKYLKNTILHYYIDMSNTEYIAKLSENDIVELSDKLMFIVQKLDTEKNLCRLRFNKFNSVNDFELISDLETKSPLSYNGGTCPTICDGLSFEIKDKKIVQKYNNKETI